MRKKSWGKMSPFFYKSWGKISWGKMSLGQNASGAKFSWDKMSPSHNQIKNALDVCHTSIDTPWISYGKLITFSFLRSVRTTGSFLGPSALPSSAKNLDHYIV